MNRSAPSSTVWPTHQPGATKDSAAAACLASSRVMRRTRTFVSTARMPLPRVAPDTRLELLERLPLWGARGEDRPMDILGGVTPRPADHNCAAVGSRLEDRPRSNTK